MSCRSKSKPRKNVPKKYFLLNSVWLDAEADDFNHFHKLKRFGQLRYWVILLGWSCRIRLIWILNFQNLQGSPLRHGTPPHLSRFRWEIHPHPFPTLPDSRRSGAWAPSSPISLPSSKTISGAVCFRASATTCSSGAVCRPCRARHGYKQTPNISGCKILVQGENHLRHLLLQEPNIPANTSSKNNSL